MEIHRDYPCHKANYQRGRALPVSFLVIHYVGALGGAKNNAVHYHKNRPGVSAHYFVGHKSESATVYQSVQDSDTAWHCGRTDGKYKHPECRNANSIGIEMCCHQDQAGRWYFDPETVDRAVELTRALMEKYHINTDHVIRHYDVTGKVCPAPYVNDPAAWAAFKKRLEESDMTKEEVQAIADEAVRAVAPKRYETLNDVPTSYQTSVRKLMETKALVGRSDPDPTRLEDNLLDVDENFCRVAVTLDKLGLLDKQGP